MCNDDQLDFRHGLCDYRLLELLSNLKNDIRYLYNWVGNVVMKDGGRPLAVSHC